MVTSEVSSDEYVSLSPKPSTSIVYKNHSDTDCGDDLVTRESEIDVQPPLVSKNRNRRTWDRRNCCLFCEKQVTNFTRHLFRNHPEEVEVQKLLAITDPDPKIQKKRRQAVTDDLRNRGNYIHNSNVVTDNAGRLIPNRRKYDEDSLTSPSSFVVCRKCLGTFRRATFYRHHKKCNPGTNNLNKDVKRVLAYNSLSIISNFSHASKEFQANILPKLRNDDISLIVKNDPLIIAYGCRLLKKKKERRSRKAICSKMRDLAYLLKIVRENHPDITKLQDLIDPKHFEYFIEAVKIMSGFDEETGYVKVVSMPARIRPEILGCIEIVFTNTIMDSYKSSALKDHIKNKISEFKLLLESNWQWEISSNAEKTRKRNLMTKAQVMPLDTDIQKLTTKIHKLEIKYHADLKADITVVNYENLCEVTIAHIILLDRKRSGDVAEAELQYYLNRKTEEISPQVLEMLGDKEKQAISDLDIFQIPGKRVRSVPILLTKMMSKNIDLLIACRSRLNISPNNKYLFARPLTEEPFDGGRCLNIIKNMCNLKKPEMVTATGLRHHIATMSQVHAKTSDQYTEHLANFLGHDMHVHASNYRLPLQAIQKGVIGSKLLEMERNVPDTEKNCLDNKNENEENYNKDKSPKGVHEIEKKCKTTKIIDNDDKGGEIVQKQIIETEVNLESSDTESSLDIPTVPLKRKTKTNILSDDDSISQQEKDTDVELVHTKTTRRRKKSYTKWSTAEIAAVKKHLKKFITLKKNPGKAICEKVLQKELVLHNRTWMQVNTYINNIYKKKL